MGLWIRHSRDLGTRHTRVAQHALSGVKLRAFLLIAPVIARLPVPTLARILPPKQTRTLANQAYVDDLVRRVNTALLHRPTVQQQRLRSLTLYYFLSRAGFDVTLCFGVRPQHGKMAGYCWLDMNGRPFLELDDPLPHFAAVYRIPAVKRT